MLGVLEYFLTCLILTIILEWIMAGIVGVRSRTDFYLMFLVNVLTNPVVVFLQSVLVLSAGINAYIVTAVLEISAVMVEGFIYSKGLDYKRINPYLLSLIFNGFSYFSGLIYFRLMR